MRAKVKNKWLWSLMPLLVLVAISCKENPAIKETQWTVDGKTYKSNISGGVLVQSDTGAFVLGAATLLGDNILMIFNENFDAGIYKIPNILEGRDKEDLINIQDLNHLENIHEYQDDECLIFISVKGGKTYLPIFDDAGAINITKTGGKFTAEFNNLRMGYIKNDGEIIEVQASGKVVQKGDIIKKN